LFSNDDENMTAYIALIHKDPDSDYGVSFPDLPGCVTAGSTLDEAIAMAKEALALHIEGLLDDDESIRAPTPADKIDRDDALLITAIEIPDNLKVERINITIPALALQRFDAFAERRSMTRSGLLVEAAHRWIAQESVPAVRAGPSRAFFQRDDALEAHLSTVQRKFDSDWEQASGSMAQKEPTEAALSAIQHALRVDVEPAEELQKNWTISEDVAERILWLTQELDKAVRILMESRNAAEPAPKERA
jgi:predicted RNase H-like HicB family nuclease